jgi:MFS family permease
MLALLGTAFFMTTLDGTSLLTALPSLEGHLGLSAGQVQWCVTIYGLAFGGVLLACGRAADLLGRRRMLMTGLGLRAASSLISGVAWSGPALIAGRAAQGLSAAIIAPAALSMVMTIFPDGPERNKALGIWGGLGGTGATAGLLLGGVIATSLGWRWIFLVNVPVAIALLVASPAVAPKDTGHGGGRLDAAGALTITGALLTMAYLIITIPDAGWMSWHTAGLAAAAVALVALFWFIETHTQAPLLPAALLRSGGLVAGSLVLLAAGMSVDGMLVTLTTFTQTVLGYSPAQFGLLAAVMTVTAVAGGLAGQRIVTQAGARPVALCGMTLLGSAALMLTRISARDSTTVLVAGAMVVFGAGMGAAAVAGQIAALRSVLPEFAGVGASLTDTAFALGTALGVVITTTIALATAHGHATGRHANAGAAAGLLSGAYRWAFAATAAFAVFGLASAWLLTRSRQPRPRTRPAASSAAGATLANQEGQQS